MNLLPTKNIEFEPNMRQSKLLKIIMETGFTETDAAAKVFGKTTQTIRRDFEVLEEHGLIRRVHGGAKAPHGYINRPYSERLASRPDQKNQIGIAAANLIKENSCVFLSLGTSTEAVARHLLGHAKMHFVTNNFNIANVLQTANDSILTLCGGQVRKLDGGMVDTRALDLIGDYRFDYGVIGTGAITKSGGLYCGSLDEARMVQAVIANSDKIILVADEEKIGRKANHKMATLEDIDVFVTENIKEPSLKKLCRMNNVKLVLASKL